MPSRRTVTAFLAAVAVGLPIAACGEDDAQREADQARDDIQRELSELEGNLDDLSEQDLREALDDAERAAESGSRDAKRRARELEREIERELNERK